MGKDCSGQSFCISAILGSHAGGRRESLTLASRGVYDDAGVVLTSGFMVAALT